MPATLRWNRLVIAATDEAEFIRSVFEYFPQLLQLPYEHVEMDITGSVEITEDAFRSIALKLIGGEAGDKQMVIRIPESVERYFKHANLFRVVDIDVVRPIPKGAEPATVEKVRAKLQAMRRGKATSEPASQPTKPAPKEAAPKQPAPLHTTPAWLVDTESGSRHPIAESTVVGREPPSDLVYQIPTISKRHFQIRRAENGFLLEDLRSTNGTYLNGLPVQEAMPLRDGDELVVAITLKHPKGARIFKFTTTPA